MFGMWIPRSISIYPLPAKQRNRVAGVFKWLQFMAPLGWRINISS